MRFPIFYPFLVTTSKRWSFF